MPAQIKSHHNAPRHDNLTPSAWVVRFADLVPSSGTVLDVAAGRGRHALLFARRGCRVTAIDRDSEALAGLAEEAGIETIRADLEDGSPWPLAGQRFDAVVVVNYLYRPLLPVLCDAVATGGVLIYETFAQGNEAFGQPRNPDFLLRDGELLEAVQGRLRVIAYEHGKLALPRPAVIQRICAGRDSDPKTSIL
ncbi:MAG: methyltransferase domain-containing protein [Alphaproteobacteria bacterium]|nr:methyltransferase domain-containing protein [Alphaproteobacteria bacterium]